jgi:hypothetical protein
LLVVVLSLITAIAAVQTLRLWQRSQVAPAAPESRLEITTPAVAVVGDPNDLVTHAWLAISPDGSTVAYSAFLDGTSLLWLRALDSVTTLSCRRTASTLP